MNTELSIRKLKNAINVKRDIELADKLGIPQSTLSTWKARNYIDLLLIKAKFPEINLDWSLSDNESEDEPASKIKKLKELLLLKEAEVKKSRLKLIKHVLILATQLKRYLLKRLKRSTIYVSNWLKQTVS